ncbi:MAG: ATP-binding protein [Planctomycetaceae bacterium]|nr:ATP-binding protein [Planctomycetaceae bacterium]
MLPPLRQNQVLEQIEELRLPQLDLSVCPADQREARLNELVAADFMLILGNDLRVVPVVIDALAGRFRNSGICDEKTADRLAVAIEEALVNAIVHGNLEISSLVREQPGNIYEKMIQARRLDPRFRKRRVRVICRYGLREGSIVVRDEGKGFDVAALPDPTNEENLSRAYGRGILLMRAFFDDVNYSPRGNAVTLVKQKPSPSSVGEKISSLVAN